MVYRPREDSYLLKEFLEKKDLEEKTCLDIGTGSGILAITMAKTGADVTAIDIDPEALEYATERAEEEGLSNEIKFMESNLFENIVRGQEFDLITFNPPYLPKEKGVKNDKTWSGGENGVEATEKFLENVNNYLKDQGEALVILSSHSEIEELIENYSLEVVEKEKTWFETLYIGKLG